MSIIIKTAAITKMQRLLTTWRRRRCIFDVTAVLAIMDFVTAVTHICYTNSDTSLLIDATFSASELLTCGTVCPLKPRTFLD